MLNCNVVYVNWILGLVQLENGLPGLRHPRSHGITMVIPMNMLAQDFIAELWHLEIVVPVSSRITAEEVQFLFLNVGLVEGDGVHILTQWMVDSAGKM